MLCLTKCSVLCFHWTLCNYASTLGVDTGVKNQGFHGPFVMLEREFKDENGKHICSTLNENYMIFSKHNFVYFEYEIFMKSIILSWFCYKSMARPNPTLYTECNFKVKVWSQPSACNQQSNLGTQLLPSSAPVPAKLG